MIRKYFLLALIVFAALTNIPLIISRTIPFMYDHGRDSVQVMEMVLSKIPKLIGPRASIPGLFFGPAWYYLLAASFIVGNFSPLSPVYMMLFITLIEICLLYRYFGKTAAIIAASGMSWLGLSTNAWNPNVMPLIMLGLLIVIKKMDKQEKLKYWLWLGGLTSLAFHFSSAYAVTLLISVPLIIRHHRFNVTAKNISAAIIGFFVPFIPQLIFELRHEFLQTKAIIAYFSTSNGEREINFFRPLYELAIQWSKMIFPTIPKINGQLQILISLVFLSLTLYLFRDKLKNFKKDKFIFDTVYLLIPAYLLFSLTHFSSWYWYSTLPLITILYAKYINMLENKVKLTILILLLSAPVINLVFYYKVNQHLLTQNPGFLPAKEQAISWIYSNIEGKPFAVYHFLPDVYDYAYQYLWLIEGIKGNVVPVDFSYRPNESAYIPEKQSIMKELDISVNAAPEYIFYIVETPFYMNFLDSWWHEQKYSKLIESAEIVPGLTVYKTLP